MSSLWSYPFLLSLSSLVPFDPTLAALETSTSYLLYWLFIMLDFGALMDARGQGTYGGKAGRQARTAFEQSNTVDGAGQSKKNIEVSADVGTITQGREYARDSCHRSQEETGGLGSGR